jgi:hypothetical protein
MSEIIVQAQDVLTDPTAPADLRRFTRNNVQDGINQISTSIISGNEHDDHRHEWMPLPGKANVLHAEPVSVGRIALLLADQAQAARKWRELYDSEASNARTAMDIIGARLMQEADDRGWCEQYDSIINDINENLSKFGLELPTRVREFELEVCVTWHGQSVTDMFVTIEAQSEEDAWEIFFDDPETYLGEGLVEIVANHIDRFDCSVERA